MDTEEKSETMNDISACRKSKPTNNDLQINCLNRLDSLSNDPPNSLSQCSTTFILDSWKFIFKELITQNRKLTEKNTQLSTVQDQMKKQFKEQLMRNNEFQKELQSLKENIQQHEHDNLSKIKPLQETNTHLNSCIIQLNIRLNNNELRMEIFENDNRQLTERIHLLEKRILQQEKAFIELPKDRYKQSRRNDELQIEVKEQTVQCEKLDDYNKDQKITKVQDDNQSDRNSDDWMNKIEHIPNIETSKPTMSVSCSNESRMDVDIDDAVSSLMKTLSEMQPDDQMTVKTGTEATVSEIQIKSSKTVDSLMEEDDQREEIMKSRNNILTKTIKQFDNQTMVSLKHKGLTDQDMKIVVQEAVVNKQCKYLWLNSNQITSIGVSVLADALYNNKILQKLDLSDNKISDNGVSVLVKVLLTNTTILKKLYLGNNRITDEGMKYLAQMMKTNNTLTHLSLYGNNISDIGLQLVANAIEKYNKTIAELSLYSNELITDMSVDFLLQMIRQCSSLKRLHISDCSISQIGKKRLVKAQQFQSDFEVSV